ncbi:U7 snRNA-associated Sm-like protein LSm11 isoform X1 [Latimeria chalumnae]|uniref:LSM11, U7 small nuclear RNA associated n=1 Tax=Latimeria chalumnae TaxID=7897 RepID=H3B714_LATCH|nr:PREDICTED: U7 snRNA-associated Sm-like protein LSm11 isoform X1 [Latimeria chalumnae]|eukprot:XP_005993124.1 PREDICTED: U7 snRNA-associated Sm-like protein LSm11 isoform X1 [Latimeria chalumnae]
MEEEPEEEEAADGRERRAESGGDEEAAKLDVSSSHFDPLLALYSPQTPLPYPNVRAFNNLAAYESFLLQKRGQGGSSESKKKKKRRGRGEPDPERIQRLRALVLPEKRGEEEEGRRGSRKQRAPKNVLTRMPVHKGSPLGELYRCVHDRIKINVHIRTFKGLRGVCSGFLVAFDKFWNMALVDVDETFRKPILGKAFYNEAELTVTRLFDRLRLQEASADKGTHVKTADEVHVSPQGSSLENPPGVARIPKGSASAPHPVGMQKGAVHPEAEEEARGAGAMERTVKKETEDNRTCVPTGSEKRKKKRKPKVDYQQVSTRHLHQLFIRGENVLLVQVGQ